MSFPTHSVSKWFDSSFPGIFRISGSQAVVQQLKKAYDNGRSAIVFDSFSLYARACLIQPNVLRILLSPLIP